MYAQHVTELGLAPERCLFNHPHVQPVPVSASGWGELAQGSTAAWRKWLVSGAMGFVVSKRCAHFCRVKLYLVISYGRFIENLARLWGIWVVISGFTYDKQLLILPNPACVFFFFFFFFRQHRLQENCWSYWVTHLSTGMVSCHL